MDGLSHPNTYHIQKQLYIINIINLIGLIWPHTSWPGKGRPTMHSWRDTRVIVIVTCFHNHLELIVLSFVEDSKCFYIHSFENTISDYFLVFLAWWLKLKLYKTTQIDGRSQVLTCAHRLPLYIFIAIAKWVKSVDNAFFWWVYHRTIKQFYEPQLTGLQWIDAEPHPTWPWIQRPLIRKPQKLDLNLELS